MNTQSTRILRKFPLVQLPLLALLAVASALLPQRASAEANYVYHERTTADPGGGGQYVTRLNPTSAENYPLLYKVEFQFYTDNARVYYTTDGSTPAGSFGTPSGTTAVLTGSYIGTFGGGPVVDVISNTIPAQSAGTVVKYIVSAWHSGGGAEIFGNGPGAPCGCGAPTSSSALATVHQYTVGSTTNLYWDSNGTTAGAGAAPAGSWGTSSFWSSVLDGTAATGAWTAGRNAIFSAGADATGSYTVALVGNQTTGGLTIEEGTVSFLASNAVVLAAGPATVNSGATLVMDSSARVSQTAGSVWTLNGGTIRNENVGVGGSFVDIDSTITLSALGGTLSKTVSNVLTIVETGSVISGPGSLTKTGIGVVALASSNTYSGATFINDGELRMRTTLNRLPTNTDVTISSTGILNLNGIATTIGSLSGSGRVGFSTTTLHINGANNTVFSGSLSNQANYGASGAASGAGRISKRGTGSLTLAGLNGITGSITNFEGTINVAPGAIMCAPTLDLIMNGGTLNMSNTAQTVLTLSGPSGTLNLGSGHTLTVNPTSGTRSYYGNITGPGTLTKTGAGVLGLGGSSTFTGPLNISVGKILALSPNSLGSASGDTIVAAGAELLFDGATNIFTIAEPVQIAAAGTDGGAIVVQNSANITLSGPITLTGDATNTVSGTGTAVYNNANAFTSLANQNLTLQGGAGTGNGGTISGIISLGTGSLTKLQGGRWTLSGANSYSGGTFVNAGTIEVANTTGSATGSGAVIVALGASLTGNGTISGSVAVNGTVSPGHTNIATLTLDDDVTAAGTTRMDLNTGAGQTSDLIVGVNTLTLGGTLNATNIGPALVAGNSFPLFTASSYVGSFASITPATPGSGLAWDNIAINNSGTLTVHANPVANADPAGAQNGQTITIPVAKLLANDIGELGETLSVTAVGANATLGGGLVTYTAPLIGSADTINYTLSDGRGGTNAGTINVTISSPEGFNKLSGPTGSGPYSFSYLGIPGQNYALDESPNLVAPYTWFPVQTNTASGNGSLDYLGVPLSYPSGSFRTRHVP